MRLAKTLLFAVGLAATAVPARAAEPSRFAVMGVRLYMSAQEVLTTLYAQGVPDDAVTEHVHPCALHAEAGCTDTITARLPDGPIVVRFTDVPPGFNDGREAAFSVAYTLQRPPASTDELRSVAEERFGGLAAGTGDVWCAVPSPRELPGEPPGEPPAGVAQHAAQGNRQGCAADQPRMSFDRDHNGKGTLSLSDPGLANRLGPSARW